MAEDESVMCNGRGHMKKKRNTVSNINLNRECKDTRHKKI